MYNVTAKVNSKTVERAFSISETDVEALKVKVREGAPRGSVVAFKVTEAKI